LDESFTPQGLVHWKPLEGKDSALVNDGLELLRQTYTNKVGYEFMYIEVNDDAGVSCKAYLSLVKLSVMNSIIQ
jgi:2-oxoglutarate dehydrogenase complex dehydrogenase (E1) component-like enzyme